MDREDCSYIDDKIDDVAFILELMLRGKRVRWNGGVGSGVIEAMDSTMSHFDVRKDDNDIAKVPIYQIEEIGQ